MTVDNSTFERGLMPQFYSYMWLREDGSPYYVGKGTGRRAFTSDGHGNRRPKSRTRILTFPMLNEAEAFESEIALIDLFGRKDLGTGCLRNMTDGGENPPNWKGRKRGPQSEEHRRKNSEGHKGLNLGHRNYTTVEGIEKMRASKTGKHPSSETREKMSQSQKVAWLMRKAPGTVQL